MRNADIADIKRLSTGVMYMIDHKWFGQFKAHIKQAMMSLDGWIDPWLVETAEGSLLVVERSWIKPVPRKQGSPKKPKRVCQKGTKPWLSNCVPYDKNLIADGVHVVCRNGKELPIDFSSSKDPMATYHLNSFDIDTGKNGGGVQWDITKIILNTVDYDSSLIKMGTKVLCRDGKIRTVLSIDKYYGVELKECPNLVNLESGMGNFTGCTHFYCDIMKIIVDNPICPQQEPCVEKKDKYNGYAVSVWHFWDGKTSVPPVDGDVKVWFRYYDEENIIQEPSKPEKLRWEWLNTDWDIIAFKIMD